MRITLVGPRHSNAPHGAEVGIHNALDSLGYETQILDPRQRNDISYIEILDFQPDFVLVPGCTPGYDFIVDLSKLHLRPPIVNWNSEEIRLPEYRERVIKFGALYDHIFHFDITALEIYRDLGLNNVSFLMQAFDPARHVHIDVPREPVIQFIGSVGGKHENRLHLISYLKKNGVPIKATTCHDPQKNSELYSRAAASLNLGLHTGEFDIDSFRAYGLQQRIFESFGSNTLVLTNEIEKMDADLCRTFGLTDKFNVLFYNKSNVVELARMALDPAFIEYSTKIVEELKREHTYAERIRHMINILKIRGLLL